MPNDLQKTHFKENCKYKKEEKLSKEVSYSIHNFSPSSLSTMPPPSQTTLGRDLSLETPPPPLPPDPGSDLTTLAAMVEDIRPARAPSGDPSLFTCKFNDATLLGYNSTTGVTCATRANL